MNRSVKLPSFRHFQDRFLTTNLEYVNGVFQTGFLYFGFGGGVGNGALERGWGRVGAGLGLGWGGGWGRVGEGFDFYTSKTPFEKPR